MLKFLKKFEKMIVTTLMVMMVVTILLATIQLSWFIIKVKVNTYYVVKKFQKVMVLSMQQ
jgi:hypothetical protein